MGWFDGFKRIKDPVRGTAQIVSTTRAPHAATSGNCRMHLVVTVPGHASFAIDDEFIVKVKKWPSPGQTLPVEASQSDPTKFKILWDEIQDWDVGAAAQAQQLAAAMNQQPPPVAPEGQQPPPGQVTSSTVMINGRPATPEELKQYEADDWHGPRRRRQDRRRRGRPRRWAPRDDRGRDGGRPAGYAGWRRPAEQGRRPGRRYRATRRPERPAARSLRPSSRRRRPASSTPSARRPAPTAPTGQDCNHFPSRLRLGRRTPRHNGRDG